MVLWIQWYFVARAVGCGHPWGK